MNEKETRNIIVRPIKMGFRIGVRVDGTGVNCGKCSSAISTILGHP